MKGNNIKTQTIDDYLRPCREACEVLCDIGITLDIQQIRIGLQRKKIMIDEDKLPPLQQRFMTKANEELNKIEQRFSELKGQINKLHDHIFAVTKKQRRLSKRFEYQPQQKILNKLDELEKTVKKESEVLAQRVKTMVNPEINQLLNKQEKLLGQIRTISLTQQQEEPQGKARLAGGIVTGGG